MSSIVTAVPSGAIPTWCIKSPWFGPPPNNRQGCANSTLGQSTSDFETICCDGNIIDNKFDIFRLNATRNLDLKDLYCCQYIGPQKGGIGPVDTAERTMCRSGTPTPLASLAATNTDNVQDFLVTYTSASFGSSTTGDFVPTQTPQCLWMYTVSKAVKLTDITVAANTMSSLSGDCLGYTCSSSSVSVTSATTTMASQSRTTSAGAATTTSSSAGARAMSLNTISVLACMLLIPLGQIM